MAGQPPETGRPGEFALIARYFAPMAGAGGLGLLDDAACIAPPQGHDLVITADALVADVHFFASDPPGSIARKALAVNLSDLAAKGAAPLGFVLSLALPKDWREDWLAAFAEGLAHEAGQGGCPLLGGDTVSTSGPLTLSITAFGAVPNGKMVRRAGAKPGDMMCVSGTIGDGSLGLKVHGPDKPTWVAALNVAQRNHLADRYLHPQARGLLAPLVQRHASASMDLSDGLIGDARKLLAASNVGAKIDLDLLPLSDAARAALMADPSCARLVWTGGDDYELFCAVPEKEWPAFLQGAAALGVPVTRIGIAAPSADRVQFLSGGAEVEAGSGSYHHF
ncbi:MAG: thiamine-phosphate kinase [Bosea sp. (in: a-proteobacteria)]